MKKLLCLSLAVIMVLLACPLSALAVTTTGTVVIKDSNGNVPSAASALKDINSAFDWVYSQDNSEEYTIYLTSNVTTDTVMKASSYDNTKVKTVKIDGQGYTLTGTDKGYNAVFYGLGLYNLKLSNLNILSNTLNTIDWSPRLNNSATSEYHKFDVGISGVAGTKNAMVGSHAEFTNVTISALPGATAGTFKFKGGDTGVKKATYHVTMTNCEFNCNTTDTMFMMNCGVTLDLDIIGTTLNYTRGADDNDANSHIAQMNSMGCDISVENYTDPTTGNVKVSKLISTPSSTRAMGGIFYPNNASAEFNFSFAKGTELTVGGSNKKEVFFIHPGNGNVTIDDQGAKLIAKQNVLAGGAKVYLYSVEEPHVWLANGAVLSEKAPIYTNASATSDVIFTKNIPEDPSGSGASDVAYIYKNDGSKTFFTSLQAAVDALGDIYAGVTTSNLTHETLWKAAGSPVIYLFKDINLTQTIVPSWWNNNYDPLRVRTVVIKSAMADRNPVITSTAAGAVIRYNSYYNLTFENIDMDCNGGFAVFWSGYNGANNSGKSTANFINCNISATGTSDEGLVFKVTGNKNQTKTENYVINFVNTKVVAEKGVNAVFLFHHGAAGELNIDGKSSITHHQEVIAAGGDTVFMLGTNRFFDINMASGSSITSTVVSSQAPSYQIFRTEESNAYAATGGVAKNTINIEDGVKLTINAANAYTKPVYFVSQLTKPTTAKTVINVGNNVEFNVNAKANALGFEIVNGQDYETTNGGNFLFWKVKKSNGTASACMSDVFAASTSGALSVTSVCAAKSDFDILDGASLRTVPGQNGIRFTSYISDELLNTLKELGVQYTFGTLIGKYSAIPDNAFVLDLATGADDAVALTIPCTKFNPNYETEVEGADNVFHAAVLMNSDNVNPKRVYSLQLAARAYLSVNCDDGASVVYSAFDINNVRSMYEIANNLVNKDSKYMEIDIISTILSTVQTGDPNSIVLSIAPGSKVLNSSTTCKEVILSGITSKTAIVNAFTSQGYSTVDFDGITGAKYETILLTDGVYLVTLYWSSAKSEMRIMWEDVANNVLEVLKPNANTGKGTVQLVEIGTDRETEKDNPLNGICFIIKLSNGHAIIYDGGFENATCANNLMNTIEALDIAKDSSGKYLIDAWVISHGHGDHYGTFQKFASLHGNKISLKYFMHNLPGDANVASDDCNEAKLESILYSTYAGVKRINPHAGVKYYIDNVTIDMLYTPELLYTNSGKVAYFNDTSIVFKLSAGGESILLYGDSAEAASATMWERYESTTFKSDILQITHHGLYTTSGGHTWTYVKKVYEATGAKYAVMGMHSKYGPDSRNGRFTVMIQWANAGYQISYVMNEADKQGQSSISQTYYDNFVQSVKNGTNTYATLYGYDGINKIVNDKGLVTYCGGNNDEPMIIIFVLGDGTVGDPIVNSELDVWLAAN